MDLISSELRNDLPIQLTFHRLGTMLLQLVDPTFFSVLYFYCAKTSPKSKADLPNCIQKEHLNPPPQTGRRWIYRSNRTEVLEGQRFRSPPLRILRAAHVVVSEEPHSRLLEQLVSTFSLEKQGISREQRLICV